MFAKGQKTKSTQTPTYLQAGLEPGETLTLSNDSFSFT